MPLRPDASADQNSSRPLPSADTDADAGDHYATMTHRSLVFCRDVPGTQRLHASYDVPHGLELAELPI